MLLVCLCQDLLVFKGHLQALVYKRHLHNAPYIASTRPGVQGPFACRAFTLVCIYMQSISKCVHLHAEHLHLFVPGSAGAQGRCASAEHKETLSLLLSVAPGTEADLYDQMCTSPPYVRPCMWPQALRTLQLESVSFEAGEVGRLAVLFPNVQALILEDCMLTHCW